MSQSDAQKKTFADRIEDAILATLERIFPGHLARMTRNKAFSTAEWLIEIELGQMKKLNSAIKTAADYDQPGVLPDIWLVVGNPAIERFTNAMFNHNVPVAVLRETRLLESFLSAVKARDKEKTVEFLKMKERAVGERLGYFEAKGVDTRGHLQEFQKALQDIRDAITALEFDEVPAGQFLSA